MKRKKGPRLGTGKKALFSLATVLILFGVLEGVLGLAGFEYDIVPGYISFHQERYMFAEGARTFERDDTLFWRFVPDQQELGINSQGFRGATFSAAKALGMKRILCLGCSVTFGLHEPKAYASYLEEMLNGSGGDRSYEVYNLGVPGYSSLQGLRLFETRGLEYEPDLITVLFGWNDHWLMKSLPDRDQKPPPPLARTLNHSRLYQFLFYLYMEFHERNIRSASSPDDVRVPLPDYMSNLAGLIGMARKKGIDIVLVTAPTSIRDGKDIPGFLVRDGLLIEGMDLPALHAAYNTSVRSLAERMAVPLADCAKALEPDITDLMMKDGIHPNEEGHKRIAGVIYRTILEDCPDFRSGDASRAREEK